MREHARRWREVVRRRVQGLTDDRGSAVVEFLGTALVLLVPLVYLILVLAQLQAAAFAAEGAAREAGRVLARASSLGEASEHAGTAVELAFADQGIAVDGAAVLTVACELDPCLSPGGQVRITVDVAVPLPLIPTFVQKAVPATIPVSAGHVSVVDRFADAP